VVTYKGSLKGQEHQYCSCLSFQLQGIMREAIGRPTRQIPGSMTEITSKISGFLIMGWSTQHQAWWQQMGYACLEARKEFLHKS